MPQSPISNIYAMQQHFQQNQKTKYINFNYNRVGPFNTSNQSLISNINNDNVQKSPMKRVNYLHSPAKSRRNLYNKQ